MLVQLIFCLLFGGGMVIALDISAMISGYFSSLSLQSACILACIPVSQFFNSTNVLNFTVLEHHKLALD